MLGPGVMKSGRPLGDGVVTDGTNASTLPPTGPQLGRAER